MKTYLFLLALLSVNISKVAANEAQPADKSQYTLWNPTPRELMRPLTADRPDLTESPYTIDAGHIQVEVDLLGYTKERYKLAFSDERTTSWSVFEPNFRLGLNNSSEIQFILPAYNSVRTKDRISGTVKKQSGFGDFVTRYKLNLWGNDEGNTAFALLPYIKWPTASRDIGNGSFEGGIVLPFGMDLPCGWDFGTQMQFDVSKDEEGGGYHPDFSNTLTVGHNIVGNLHGYVEFFSLVSTEKNSRWISTFGFGLTYLVTKDLQLDGGVNFGLTRSSPEWSPFIGFSWRY